MPSPDSSSILCLNPAIAGDGSALVPCLAALSVRCLSTAHETVPASFSVPLYLLFFCLIACRSRARMLHPNLDTNHLGHHAIPFLPLRAFNYFMTSIIVILLLPSHSHQFELNVFPSNAPSFWLTAPWPRSSLACAITPDHSGNIEGQPANSRRPFQDGVIKAWQHPALSIFSPINAATARRSCAPPRHAITVPIEPDLIPFKFCQVRRYHANQVLPIAVHECSFVRLSALLGDQWINPFLATADCGAIHLFGCPLIAVPGQSIRIRMNIIMAIMPIRFRMNIILAIMPIGCRRSRSPIN